MTSEQFSNSWVENIKSLEFFISWYKIIYQIRYY